MKKKKNYISCHDLLSFVHRIYSFFILSSLHPISVRSNFVRMEEWLIFLSFPLLFSFHLSRIVVYFAFDYATRVRDAIFLHFISDRCALLKLRKWRNYRESFFDPLFSRNYLQAEGKLPRPIKGRWHAWTKKAWLVHSGRAFTRVTVAYGYVVGARYLSCRLPHSRTSVTSLSRFRKPRGPYQSRWWEGEIWLSSDTGRNFSHLQFANVPNRDKRGTRLHGTRRVGEGSRVLKMDFVLA